MLDLNLELTQLLLNGGDGSSSINSGSSGGGSCRSKQALGGGTSPSTTCITAVAEALQGMTEFLKALNAELQREEQ